MLQSVIRVEGDRAWARTQWLEMANHGEGDQPKIGTYGIYEDEFVKLDGQWLIARRNVLNEFIPKAQFGAGESGAGDGRGGGGGEGRRGEGPGRSARASGKGFASWSRQPPESTVESGR